MTVGELVREMGGAGCLGAGQLASAVSIYEEMLREGATILLGLSGAFLRAGFRDLIAKMIKRGLVHAVLSTGEGIAHDLSESLKGREEGIGEFLLSVLKGEEGPMTIEELLAKAAKRLPDQSSFLRVASEKGIPLATVTAQDLGLRGEELSELRRQGLMMDWSATTSSLSNLLAEAKKAGAVLLGEDLLRKVVLGLSHSAGRKLDYLIQFSLDRLDQTKDDFLDAKSAQVVGEAAICLPVVVAALFERLGWEGVF